MVTFPDDKRIIALHRPGLRENLFFFMVYTLEQKGDILDIYREV